ncbi:MAG: hypothetical protein Q9P01_08395 [Anaerolineae bacterium]|nr:hypothetical protein [Anaerolineae bacterium]MDQ7034842.1 hypothetical protein [Anaerolineae bacterium]
MSTNANAMIRAGVEAYQADDKAKARQMLEKAIEIDEQSEMAWLWLSVVVESKEDQQIALENVLVINPANERAKQGLKSMGIDPETVINPAPDYNDDEYAVPSSSASVSNNAPEAAAEVYDDWVGNLGIGGNAGAASSTDDIFSDVDFSSDVGFDFGEDLFDDQVYDAYGDESNESDAEYYNNETSDYDEAYDVGDSGHYDESYDVDDSGHYGDTVSELDDLYADIGTFKEFDAALDEDIHDYDMDEFSDDPFQEPEAEEPDEPSLDDLFAQIPAKIVATRLPGSIEATPTSAYMPMAVLGILNVLAIIFIVFQLFS